MHHLLAVFVVLIIPFSVLANVVINEVAWMGMLPKEGETSQAAANNEWIELKNLDSNSINLSGWELEAQDGQPAIAISETCKNTIIQGDGYFLLERSDDNTLPGVAADCIYTGALENEGEYLVLKNSSGAIIDSMDASFKWPAGDNNTKETMQRTGDGKWITAQATPKKKNYELGIMNENQSQTQIIEPEQTKQIKAEAGEDRTVFIGQKTIFQGKVYGFDGKEIQNARFLWNFGDGIITEGNPLSHIYRYAGSYTVVLSASSGVYSDSDSLLVKVMNSPLKIIELKSGESGFVKIYNSSDYELDLAGFGLSDGKNFFYFPENSIILPKIRLIVSNEISKVNFNGYLAKFYEPDNSLIQEFKYKEEEAKETKEKVLSGVSAKGKSAPEQLASNQGSAEKQILAGPVAAEDKGEEQPESLYFWMALVFGFAILSGFVSFLFLKRNDKMQ